MDEYLEGWEEERLADELSDDDHDSDEIEHNANELVRLRPY